MKYKRRMNKNYRNWIKKIEYKFEDLIEDVEMEFDELEYKFSFKLQMIQTNCRIDL